MYEIWDVQVRRLLAEGLYTFAEAREREGTGDSVEALVLEWEARDADTGRVVAGHWGAPVTVWG